VRTTSEGEEEAARMPRADLRTAFVLDREIYDASRVDPTLLDPVVRLEGAPPARARPLVVVREYQGPQGWYIEHFVITDRRGRPVIASRPVRIGLEGQMSSDRFETVVEAVVFDSDDEHAVTFYLGEDPVGSVPVFVETAVVGDPATAAEETLRKALQKGTIAWLTVPQPGGARHTQAVWFVFTDGKVYVLSGPGEQEVPHLAEADEVEITARSKDLRSRVSNVPATARVVLPDDPLFEQVARSGLGRRLNLPDGDGALARWRATCTLVELTPRFRTAEQEARAAAGAVGAAGPTADTQPETEETGAAPGDAAAGGAAGAKADQDIHVDAQVDQAVFDQLIAEGKPERIARAKAKAAYVRAEKARIRAERDQASA
jgi:hypothetical protein